MDQTTQTIINSAEQAAQTAAPLLATGAAVGLAVTNPQAATAIATLAPIALQLLNNAMMLQQAGTLSDAQLAQLFQTVGQGILMTHNDWASQNAAETQPKTGA